jgi:hypothetical protein
MGHQRLGSIPKSKNWSQVVAAVTAGGGGAGGGAAVEAINAIADTTLTAAAPALQRATDDQGLRYTFFLLTQIALASRQDDWRESLRRLGLELDDGASVFDLTLELQRCVDDYVAVRGGSTDVGEMAQQAAGEAISQLTRDAARTLFGEGIAELQDAVRRLSTKAGFSRLGQQFFGSFMSRFLNFYLSRVTAANVGTPSLGQIGELSHFNEALDLHCKQSARIVHDFAGEWYSKTEYQHGIDLENTSGFMAVALRKLADELRQQREGA